MSYIKPTQKLISFTNKSREFEAVKKDMQSGWNIVNLIKNGNYYVGIMQKNTQNSASNEGSVFLPPKKRIKISIKS